MTEKLTDILACPVCKGPLYWHRDPETWVCRADRLAYPVEDGVPVMLPEAARRLASDDPLVAGR